MLLISKLLWWQNSTKQNADEEYLEGWEGIPESESRRKKMSPAQLAISLSKCRKDSPAYFLYEHELTRRVAKVQALPSYLSIIMTFVGIFVGWGLAQWKPLERKTSLGIIAEHPKEHDEATSTGNTKRTADKNVQPRPSDINIIVKPSASPKAYEKQNNAHDKERNTQTE